MANNTTIAEILKHYDSAELHRFILDYSEKSAEFKKAFNDRFNPSRKITGNKKNYADQVRAAFLNNSLKSRNRYRQWDDYGFDAEDVAADLQTLLDKAVFFMEAGNTDEAILICQVMIETIPGEWDANFDYDGEVQVKYDGAIDLLGEMMMQQRLALPQKEKLFQWYSREYKDKKHEYVGLNTSLQSLEDYFTDTPSMIDKTLSNIDEKINNAESDYEKENAVLSKISVLQKTNQHTKATSVIDQYIDFKKVHELRLETLMKQKKYGEAIALIKKGIQIAVTNNHPGTVIQWQEKLFDIYILQKDTKQALIIGEELFYNNHHDKRKYYDYIKKHTPENTWPQTVERLLSVKDKNNWGFNTFKAEILIEHKMWDKLFAMCLKAGTEHLEHYEKYLKPVYAKELFGAFHKYVEQQATITDKGAYMNVARVLKKMKHYPGGKEVVTESNLWNCPISFGLFFFSHPLQFLHLVSGTVIKLST